jgi:hypothetical protein
LKGRENTDNDERITIEIPKENILTPQVLTDLIENEAERKNRLLDLEDSI